MTKISLPLTISLMVVAEVLGMSVGYYVSPTYQQSMYEKQEMGLGLADRNVDLRYIDKMIAHHRGAMLLAEQVASRSHRSEVRDLAAEILVGEPKLIDQLYGWKQSWYKDSTRVSDPTVVSMGDGDADKTFDLRFLNALIAHHELGIEMAKDIRAKSSRKEILDSADAVVLGLNSGLNILKQWRNEWYGVAL